MSDLTRQEKEKLAHETDIITAAEIVFNQKGFDGASMEEIANEAQFTRRTVYQYFATKEELYFAVNLNCFRNFYSYLEVELVNDCIGFEKIHKMGLAFYRFFKDYPHAIRLMNYVGYIKETAKNGPRYQNFLVYNNRLFQKIAEVIAKGQMDGSIRKDLKPEDLAYSLAFTLTGFFYELSTNGKTFSQHFKLNEESFVLSTLNLFFQSIKA